MNITDTTARRLWNRINWIRFGGQEPSRESSRCRTKAEPFNADRVRELLAQRLPETQYVWLQLVGATPAERPAPQPSRINLCLMTSIG